MTDRQPDGLRGDRTGIELGLLPDTRILKVPHRPVTYPGCVGFNNEIRKALDPSRATPQRFVALRRAVQMFSPGGFNATFQNLELAVGVRSGSRWSADQIAHAADRLRDARARYVTNREIWDENRRRQKSSGVRTTTEEELAVFGAADCFNAISGGPGTRRYRWVGLAEFASAQGVKLAPFGPDIEPEFRYLLEAMPRASIEPRGRPVVAHYGPFSSPREPATMIEVPYRIYDAPIPDAEYNALSRREQLLMDCWFTRSDDGVVRQRHLARVVAAEEYWAIPYVLLALGDYVLEVVEEGATPVCSGCRFVAPRCVSKIHRIQRRPRRPRSAARNELPALLSHRYLLPLRRRQTEIPSVRRAGCAHQWRRISALIPNCGSWLTARQLHGLAG